jgi:hypothetical protein
VRRGKRVTVVRTRVTRQRRRAAARHDDDPRSVGVIGPA